MRIGKTYNARSVLREMDLFLKELKLSGYKTNDIRERGCGAFLVVYVSRTTALSIWLNPLGHHATYEYHGYLRGDMTHVFHSTEELEDIIMDFIHEHG